MGQFVLKKMIQNTEYRIQFLYEHILQIKNFGREIFII